MLGLQGIGSMQQKYQHFVLHPSSLDNQNELYGRTNNHSFSSISCCKPRKEKQTKVLSPPDTSLARETNHQRLLGFFSFEKDDSRFIAFRGIPTHARSYGIFPVETAGIRDAATAEMVVRINDGCRVRTHYARTAPPRAAGIE